MSQPIPLVLAGGTGTRFSPFASDKLLWPFMGKPFVSYVIETLAKCGLNSIIVVANQNNRHFFDSIKIDGVSIQIVIQDTDGGMSAALQKTRSLISKQPVLVLNADDIFETNLIKDMLKVVSDEKPETLLVGLERNDFLPVGYLNISGGKVVGIVEKPEPDKKPSNFVKLVVDYFANSDTLFGYLDKTPFAKGSDSHYEETLGAILADKPANYIAYRGFWNKLKYPYYVLEVMEIIQKLHIKSFVHPSAHISDGAHIEDGVYIDEGAYVDSGAVIKGMSYIGKNARIGNNSLVRSSFIEESTIVGFGSEVARSYVGPRCQIHHSFIGDSVLESDINMSWGTVTANLRLDGKEVSLKHPNGTNIKTGRTKLGAMIAKGAFLGINTSTMPGVCISANTQTLPGTVVKKTI